jgi:hypothetical protein
VNEFSRDALGVSDRLVNASAVFHPAVAAAGNSGTYAPPCMEIAGVQVYAYVRDGILVVSLDYDGADVLSRTLHVYGAGLAVPTVITAGHDTEPVWEALPDDAITEADARQLRKTGDRSPVWILPDWVHGQGG